MGSSWTDYFTITIVELLKSNINNSSISINGLLKIDYFRDWNLIFQIFWQILHKNCERQLIETTSFGQLVLFKVKSGTLPSFCQLTLQGTRNEDDRSHQRTSTARGLNPTRTRTTGSRVVGWLDPTAATNPVVETLQAASWEAWEWKRCFCHGQNGHFIKVGPGVNFPPHPRPTDNSGVSNSRGNPTTLKRKGIWIPSTKFC